jgi:hypothetical protein
MRANELEILERNFLTHTARHHGWALLWRADGLIDLRKGETLHLAVPRNAAHGLMLADGYRLFD